MDKSGSVVYQSGEIVPLTAQYELACAIPPLAVASGEKNIRELNANELFPNYEGRACGWHPIATSIPTVSSLQ